MSRQIHGRDSEDGKGADATPIPTPQTDGKPAVLSSGIREVTRISDDTRRVAGLSPQASAERASAGDEPAKDSAEEADQAAGLQLGQRGPENWFYRVKCDGVQVALWGTVGPGSPLSTAKETIEADENPFSREVVPVTYRGDTHRFEIVGSTRWHQVNIRQPQYVAVKSHPRVTRKGNKGRGNADLRVRFGAKWFVRHSIDELLPFLSDLCEGLGFTVEEVHDGSGETYPRAQVSKWDLCADLPRRPSAGIAECLRGHSQRGQVPWQYRTGKGWTGLHNQTKKGIKVRIYDKRREVYSGANGPQDHYKAAFTDYGLHAYPHIWRVEFSLPRKRLRRGLVRKDEEGREVERVDLESLDALNRENMDLLWSAMTGDPGQTNGYFWISQETREDHGHTSSAHPSGFWNYVRRCTTGDPKHVGWRSGPRPEGGGEKSHLMKIAAGVGGTTVARSGLDETGDELDKCITKLLDEMEEQAPEKLADLFCKRLDQRLDARGYQGDERERWREQFGEKVKGYLQSRATQPFWFRPLLDDEQEEEERTANDPHSSPLPVHPASHGAPF